MKKFYKPLRPDASCKGFTYSCDSPIYSTCTLFLLPDGRGLAVIQQRYNASFKYTWWTAIDKEINADISNSHGLNDYLENYAAYPKNGIYPVETVRKVMWALRLPPLKKMDWETRF